MRRRHRLVPPPVRLGSKLRRGLGRLLRTSPLRLVRGLVARRGRLLGPRRPRPLRLRGGLVALRRSLPRSGLRSGRIRLRGLAGRRAPDEPLRRPLARRLGNRLVGRRGRHLARRRLGRLRRRLVGRRRVIAVAAGSSIVSAGTSPVAAGSSTLSAGTSAVAARSVVAGSSASIAAASGFAAGTSAFAPPPASPPPARDLLRGTSAVAAASAFAAASSGFSAGACGRSASHWLVASEGWVSSSSSRSGVVSGRGPAAQRTLAGAGSAVGCEPVVCWTAAATAASRRARAFASSGAPQRAQ